MRDIFIKQIPNMFTVVRIIFVFIAFFLIINGYYTLGTIIIVFASITDFLDGYLAKILNAQSVLGAKLDQIADKLFEILISISIIIAGNYYLIGTLILEILFSGLIVYKSIKLKHWAVSTKAGKIKTTLLFLSIIFGLLYIMHPTMYQMFLIFWIIATLFQLFANIKIILEYNKEKHSIEKIKIIEQ